MPLFFKIDKERRLVMSTASAVVVMAEALAHQKKLGNHPDFDPSFSQLLDFTQAIRVELSGEDLEKLARMTLFAPNSRRAILVTTDGVYALGRMYEILKETRGEHGTRVFRDLDQALDWVLAGTKRA